MYQNLRETEGTKNENENLIKNVLNKLKKAIKNVPENNTFMIEENEKIINIVKNILYFNQSGEGLKILSLNQMLSRLPISLVN